MNCRGAKIDLKLGKINNQVALKKVLFIRDGQVVREQKFGHTQGLYFADVGFRESDCGGAVD
jgi:hypothetical protein